MASPQTGDAVAEADSTPGSSPRLNPTPTLRSRTSAAYRGLYVLLQREGACDFFWKARMVELDLNDVKLDIHHIFPKKWCEEHGISPRVFNAVVNKTAVSYKANRMIGGRAPSRYLEQIQTHPNVQLKDHAMDKILRSHVIEPAHLRADTFEAFYAARKAALVLIIEGATGKPANEQASTSDDDETGDADDEEDS